MEPATSQARDAPSPDPTTQEYVGAVLTMLRERVQRIVAGELTRLKGRLAGHGPLDPHLATEVTVAVGEMVTALIGPVTDRLTRLAAGPAGRWYADALRDLFALDVPTPAPHHERPRHPAQHRTVTTDRGGTMYTVVTEFTIAPAHRDSFEQNFTASMRATLTDVPGLQRAQLLRPSDGEDNASGYLASLDFDDEAAYTAFTSSEVFRAAHGQRRESFATARRVSTYQTVTQIPA